MYETGGQVTFTAKLILLALVAPILALTLLFPESSWSEVQWYLYAYWCGLTGLFLYRKYG
jgi:hypothetical protein